MKEVTVTVLLEEHELVVGTTGALLLGVTIEVTVIVLLEEQGVVASETRALLPTTTELDLEPEREPELVPDPELGATGWLLGLPEGDERIGLFVGKGVPVDIGIVVGAEVGEVGAEEGVEVGTVTGAVEVAAVVGATDDTAAAPC